jgi:hypothetical protein
MEDAGGGVTVAPDHPALAAAVRALAAWWSPRVRGHLKVERWQGVPTLASPGQPILEAAGFVRDYGGMVWSGR